MRCGDEKLLERSDQRLFLAARSCLSAKRTLNNAKAPKRSDFRVPLPEEGAITALDLSVLITEPGIPVVGNAAGHNLRQAPQSARRTSV